MIDKRKIKLVIKIIVICAILSMAIFLNKTLINTKKDYLSEIKLKSINNYTQSTTYNSDKLLINPGKGFFLRNNINDSANDKISTIYYRFNWAEIEPEENAYEWNIIDEKIEYCKENNKKFAFGIMCQNTSCSLKYVTPEWVINKGVDYYIGKSDNGVEQVVPNWKDQIFQNELNTFIEELAKKYDGNQYIAYIDIRSYGNWGEQHTDETKRNELSSEELKKYIEMYRNNFKKTLLINPWGKDEYNNLYKECIDNGISIRRDGIMKYSDGKEVFEYANGKLPTVFEYILSYNSLKEKKMWNEESLEKYIEEWKPSYIEFFPEMYDDSPELCKYIANRVGYYFRFKGAEYTNNINDDEKTEFKFLFSNDGVTQIYEPCTVYIGVLDKNYKMIEKYKTNIDAHKWESDSTKEETVNLNFEGINTGEYILAIGLFYDENDNNPTYLLGNSGKTDNNWYVFGNIKINNVSDRKKSIKEIENIDTTLATQFLSNENVKKQYSNLIENLEKLNVNLEDVNQEKLNESLTEQYKLLDEIIRINNSNVESIVSTFQKIEKAYLNLYSYYYVSDYISTNNIKDMLNEIINSYNNNTDIDLSKESILLNNARNIYNKINTDYNSENYLYKKEVENYCKILKNMLDEEIKNTADKEFKKVNYILKDNEITNKDVEVEVKLPCKNSFIEDEKGKKNTSNKIVFTENGTKDVIINVRGYDYTYKISVTNIDKIAPKVTAQNGQCLKINATDDNLKEIKIEKDGKETVVKNGQTITTPGIYKIKATDKAGNSSNEIAIVYGTYTNEQNSQVNYITIKARTKVSDIKQDGNYTIKDNNNIAAEVKRAPSSVNTNAEKDSNSYIATGDILQDNNNTYIVITLGDLSSNGDVGVADLIKLRKSLLGLTKLTKIQELAADTNQNGSVNLSDLLKERKIMVGME